MNSIIDKADIKNIEKIINSSFDWECSIEEACLIEGGAVVAQKLKMQPETKLNCSILEELDSEEGMFYIYIQMKKIYIMRAE